MDYFKKAIRKLHLWLGLGSGLVVMVVALTGSLMVFEKELEQFFAPEYYYAQTAIGEKASVDRLMKGVERAHPGAVFRQIFLFNDSERSVLFHIMDADKEVRIVSVDPYSGTILKDVAQKDRFFFIVLQLHRYLLLGDIGKSITGASCLMFVSLLLSGFILWFPKKWKHLKQRLSFKKKASLKRFNWDFHAVLGFYSLLFLLLISLTGLVWSYKWYENMIYKVADGAPKPTQIFKNTTKIGTPTSYFYANMVRTTDSIFPYKGNIRLIVPEERERGITVFKENLELGIPNIRSAIYFDRYSASLLKILPSEELSTGEKIRLLVYPIHTGKIYGYPTKIIAFLVSLFAATSPISGFLIWRGRNKKKNKR
jgi:uncharacterized iron-regulated membrane protein